MRGAYSQEIKELQEWNVALEDTLSILMSHQSIKGIIDTSLQDCEAQTTVPREKQSGVEDELRQRERHSVDRNGTLPGLSSPHVRILKHVANKTPSKNTGGDGRDFDNVLKLPSWSPPALPFASMKAKQKDMTFHEARIFELERELQDLAENSVKQMCILRDENRQLVGKQAPPPSETHGKCLSLLMTHSTSEAAQHVAVENSEEIMRQQIEDLGAQLLQKDLELKAFEDHLKCLNERDAFRHREGRADHIQVDNGVDELAGLVHELSLDRARHSLERAQAGAQIMRMHELNNVMQEGINRFQRAKPQATPSREIELATRQDRRLLGSSLEFAAGTSTLRVRPVSMAQNVMMRDSTVLSAENSALDRIPEEFEECSEGPLSELPLTTSQANFSHGHARHCRQVTPSQFFEATLSNTERTGLPAQVGCEGTRRSSLNVGDVDARRSQQPSLPEKPPRSSIESGTYELSSAKEGAAPGFECCIAGPSIWDATPPPHLHLMGATDLSAPQDATADTSFATHGAEAPPSTPIGHIPALVGIASPCIQIRSDVGTNGSENELFSVDQNAICVRDVSGSFPEDKEVIAAEELRPESDTCLSREGEQGRLDSQVRMQNMLRIDMGKHLQATSHRTSPMSQAKDKTVLFSPRSKDTCDLSMRPVSKDDTTQGPHHHLGNLQSFSSHLGLPVPVDDFDSTQQLVETAPAAVVNVGSAAADNKGVDKPPLRPPPPSPRDLVKKRDEMKEDSSNNSAKDGDLMRPAPPGGKPRRSRSSVVEGGGADGAVSKTLTVVGSRPPQTQLDWNSCQASDGLENAVEIPEGGKKRSIKKFLSGILSSVRSMSPSGARSSPHGSRDHSPSGRHASPAARAGDVRSGSVTDGDDGRRQKHRQTASPLVPTTQPSGLDRSAQKRLERPDGAAKKESLQRKDNRADVQGPQHVETSVLSTRAAAEYNAANGTAARQDSDDGISQGSAGIVALPRSRIPLGVSNGNMHLLLKSLIMSTCFWKMEDLCVSCMLTSLLRPYKKMFAGNVMRGHSDQNTHWAKEEASFHGMERRTSSARSQAPSDRVL